MFDPHDTCNVCMTGRGVREDHPDPVRAIYLTKWLVTAPYTDENEEISLVRKKRIFGKSSRSEFDPDRQILPDSIFPTFKLLDFIILGSDSDPFAFRHPRLYPALPPYTHIDNVSDHAHKSTPHGFPP